MENFCGECILQSMDSVQNSYFCAFPRGRTVYFSVIYLVRFYSPIRVQLQGKTFTAWVPFWPGRSHLPPLGLEATWPHLYPVHIVQKYHNLVTQMSVVPLLCQTNVCAPADLNAQRQPAERVSGG